MLFCLFCSSKKLYYSVSFLDSSTPLFLFFSQREEDTHRWNNKAFQDYITIYNS